MGSALKLVIAGILSVTAAASWFAPVSAAPAQGETVYYKAGFSYGPVDASVRSRIEGKSYRKNSNIALDELRYVRVLYCGFDGETKAGELIVNREIAEDIVEIFYDLYQHPYPIQEISLIDKYDADDERSMRANNTSAFNYRPISGSSTLSKHAYGMAIDINPRINPYVRGAEIQPENGSAYTQRDPRKCEGKYREQMIQKGDYVYRLFREHGFTWGGDWKDLKDYQHFEK